MNREHQQDQMEAFGAAVLAGDYAADSGFGADSAFGANLRKGGFALYTSQRIPVKLLAYGEHNGFSTWKVGQLSNGITNRVYADDLMPVTKAEAVKAHRSYYREGTAPEPHFGGRVAATGGLLWRKIHHENPSWTEHASTRHKMPGGEIDFSVQPESSGSLGHIGYSLWATVHTGSRGKQHNVGGNGNFLSHGSRHLFADVGAAKRAAVMTLKNLRAGFGGDADSLGVDYGPSANFRFHEGADVGGCTVQVGALHHPCGRDDFGGGRTPKHWRDNGDGTYTYPLPGADGYEVLAERTGKGRWKVELIPTSDSSIIRSPGRGYGRTAHAAFVEAQRNLATHTLFQGFGRADDFGGATMASEGFHLRVKNHVGWRTWVRFVDGLRLSVAFNPEANPPVRGYVWRLRDRPERMQSHVGDSPIQMARVLNANLHLYTKLAE